MNFGGAVHEAQWPSFDESKTQENDVEIALQVKGKVRSRIVVPVDISKEDAIALAKRMKRLPQKLQVKKLKRKSTFPASLLILLQYEL